MSRHFLNVGFGFFFVGKRVVLLGWWRIWERGGSEMIHSQVIPFGDIYVMVVG